MVMMMMMMTTDDNDDDDDDNVMMMVMEIKQGNRQSEFLLHDAELISSLGYVLGDKRQEDYPSEEFLRIWKLMLLNQFHDILPGSCIKQTSWKALDEY